MSLRIAFKEWAVICRALATGRQALILRKGGIAEAGGVFRPEHARFWLYPTYLHQQEMGIKPEAEPLLAEARAERSPASMLRLTHFAEVASVAEVRELDAALRLDGLHVWSEATVRQRFAYRNPGLFVLPVRVYRAAQAFDIVERPEYAGCKTWVELGEGLPTDRAVPVLGEDAFQTVLGTLKRVLSGV
jgi:hypothetical protein